MYAWNTPTIIKEENYHKGHEEHEEDEGIQFDLRVLGVLFGSK
jgi:hypothetical protein